MSTQPPFRVYREDGRWDALDAGKAARVSVRKSTAPADAPGAADDWRRVRYMFDRRFTQQEIKNATPDWLKELGRRLQVLIPRLDEYIIEFLTKGDNVVIDPKFPLHLDGGAVAPVRVVASGTTSPAGAVIRSKPYIQGGPGTDVEPPPAFSPTMRDSGTRQEFSTGAVRDAAGDKPPVGLLSPCWLWRLADAAAAHEGQPNLDGTRTLMKAWAYLQAWRDGRADADWLALASWNAMFVIAGRPLSLDFPPTAALRRLVAWLDLGAQKYNPRNWERGIPLARTTESTMRHMIAVAAGDDDEDHAAAVLCNLMFLAHTETMVKRGVLPAELDDMPRYRAAGEKEKVNG